MTDNALGSSRSSGVGRADLQRGLFLAGGVVTLLASALWLRYRSVGTNSLFLDDAWVAVGSRVSTLGDTIRTGLTSPGFSLLYRAWAAVFGHDPTMAQMLALVLGVATPVVLFLACVERGLPPSSAFLGGALLATAPAHVTYSTHLKQYSAEALAATLVLWAAWRVIDRPGDGRRWAVLTGFALAASFVSTIGTVTSCGALLVAFLAVIVTRPFKPRPVLVAVGTYAVVIVPWMQFVIRPNLDAKLTNYWRGDYLDGRGFAGGLGTRLAAVADSFQRTDHRIVLLLLLFAAAIAVARRPLVGCLLVAPTVIAVLLAALTLAPLGTGRTEIYLFPSYAFLVAVAWAEVAALVPIGRMLIRGLAVVCAIAIVIDAASVASSAYPPEHLTPLVQLVEKRRDPGDTIAVYSSAGYAYALATRYGVATVPDGLAPTNWSVRILGPHITVLPAHRDDPSKLGPSIDRLTASSRRIWLIGTHFYDKRGLPVLDWPALRPMLLARGYRITEVHESVGAELLLFTRASRPVAPFGEVGSLDAHAPTLSPHLRWGGAVTLGP